MRPHYSQSSREMFCQTLRLHQLPIGDTLGLPLSRILLKRSC